MGEEKWRRDKESSLEGERESQEGGGGLVLGKDGSEQRVMGIEMEKGFLFFVFPFFSFSFIIIFFLEENNILGEKGASLENPQIFKNK